MPYTKTNWTNGAAPPINATNLNKIENGIAEATEAAETITAGLTPKVLYEDSTGWNPSAASGFTVDGAIADYSIILVNLSDGSHGLCEISWDNGVGSVIGLMSYPYNGYIYVNTINFQLTDNGEGGYTAIVPSTSQMPANYRIGTTITQVTTVRNVRKITGIVPKY